jgi:putative flippase GtrA
MAARTVLRFGIVGLANTAVGLGVIFAAKRLLGMGDLASNVLGYAFGLGLSFALNRSWTFGYRGAVVPSLTRFLVAFAVAYLANLATVFGLRDHLRIDSYLAQAAGTVPYAVAFYVMSRWCVFSERAKR